MHVHLVRCIPPTSGRWMDLNPPTCISSSGRYGVIHPGLYFIVLSIAQDALDAAPETVWLRSVDSLGV